MDDDDVITKKMHCVPCSQIHPNKPLYPLFKNRLNNFNPWCRIAGVYFRFTVARGMQLRRVEQVQRSGLHLQIMPEKSS